MLQLTNWRVERSGRPPPTIVIGDGDDAPMTEATPDAAAVEDEFAYLLDDLTSGFLVPRPIYVGETNQNDDAYDYDDDDAMGQLDSALDGATDQPAELSLKRAKEMVLSVQVCLSCVCVCVSKKVLQI